MAKYTRDLYNRLEAETGQATGFMPVGYIQLATSQDRLHELRPHRRLCARLWHHLRGDNRLGDQAALAPGLHRGGDSGILRPG